MALKIFKGFSDKILTRELMNSVHKISQPKGKYVKNISKVRWDKNDLSWNKTLIYLFSKHKSVNIFVQWNQMLHFWVLRTASTSVCPKRLASSAGVKPHLQVKSIKVFVFHEFPKPEFSRPIGTNYSCFYTCSCFFHQKDFIDWKNSWNLAFRIHETMCWAAAKCWIKNDKYYILSCKH